MRRWMFLIAAAILVQALALGIAAARPDNRSTIQGMVQNSLGQPLAGVRLLLMAPDGKVYARTASDAQGQFVFTRVPAGRYSVEARAAAYEPAQTVVTARPGANAPVVVVLASQAALTVSVIASRLNRARNELSPETGGSVYHFTQKAIQELPQGENASMSTVLLQAPGVAQDSYGQIHIRGEHAEIQYRVNGIELPEGISSGFSQTLNPRFAQSISLLEGALPAQYGYHTAGVVEIQTKSGESLKGGNLDMYGGQRATLQPGFELGGVKGNLSYYTTGFYLQNDRGLEPPTAGPVAIHDQTLQGNGFGYLSYILSPTSRLSLLGGFNVSHFEIPNSPGQTPAFTLQGVSNYPSAMLSETQLEQNYYVVAAWQGVLADNIDYQLAGYSRYSTLSFYPDETGDLIYNGIASRVFRSDWDSGVQGDFAYHGLDHHTIRAGWRFTGEHAEIDNHALVFPGSSMGQTSDVPEAVVDDTGLTEWLYGVYIQDEWHPLPKLTLNYGVRFDLYDGLTRADQASPRAGAVYKLSETIDLHAAYARYFTPPPLESVSGEDIHKFAGTTGEPAVLGDGNISPERSHYFDAGATKNLPYGLRVDIDSYYKISNDLLDEGQFGPTLIFTPFNYEKGRQYGVEFSTSLTRRNLTAYTNFTYSVAQGTTVVSDQFLFSAQELAYIKSHYVYLDHDQTFTASAGLAYNLYGFLFTLDGMYASGLRTGFANTGNQPFYIQFDGAIVRSLMLPTIGQVEGRVTLVNMGDWIYQLRSGSGIGVFAPQYGPRRTLYAGLKWYFPWSSPATH